MSMTIGSLFSGIGGLEAGLEWAGVGHVVWQCEIDPYCREEVLAQHWPDATRYDDVRTMGADTPRVDVICGGPPCQDISVAGDQAGLDGKKSGLFWEMVRLVRILRPRYLVLENVRALLTSPPGRPGHDFGRVLGTLADLGYDAEWHVLRASDAVDAEGNPAPHGRARVVLIAWQRVADADGDISDGEQPECVTGGSSAAEPGRGREAMADADGPGQPQPQEGGHGIGGRAGDGGEAVADAEVQRCGSGGLPGGTAAAVPRSDLGGEDEAVAHSAVERLEEWEGECRNPGEEFAPAAGAGGRHPQPRLGRAPDGIPHRLDAVCWPAWQGQRQHRWEPPRTARGVPFRAARLRALGNAVVPHVGRLVGLRLLEIKRRLGR